MESEEAMPYDRLQERVTELLRLTNEAGGYASSLVCTPEGLPVASDGQAFPDEVLAGFTSLFDDIVTRAARDLGVDGVDEVSLRAPQRGRLVIRPMCQAGVPRLFLVVSVPRGTSWRRHTSLLLTRLQELLEPMLES